MPKEKIPFAQFVEAVPPKYSNFVTEMDKYLLDNNFTRDIKEAKSGYLVSYAYAPTKRVVANYVFRKKGPILRIYTDNIARYEQCLDDLPQSMQDIITKAGPCKRLLNPDACNPACLMGYEFMMNNEAQTKCRYNCFMFYLSEEANPYLTEIMQHEVAQRIKE